MGLVIGRGGVTIKGIQDRTRVHIQIPQQPDAQDPRTRTIEITGEPQCIEAAKVEINALFSARNATLGPNANTQHMKLANDKVGLIIGKGGCVINDIQQRTRTNMCRCLC